MERIRLKQLRGSKSLSTIACKLGITPQMLGAIERGDRTPSLTLAKRIADHYIVAIDDIFFEINGNDTLPEATGTEG